MYSLWHHTGEMGYKIALTLAAGGILALTFRAPHPEKVLLFTFLALFYAFCVKNVAGKKNLS